MNKLTSFTHHVTSEGDRLSITYSVISEDGTIKDSNIRKNYIVLPGVENNDEILDAIHIIENYLNAKITD